jgi:Dolichyl-phosphate-mannose-protein mannosyltransferase
MTLILLTILVLLIVGSVFQPEKSVWLSNNWLRSLVLLVLVIAVASVFVHHTQKSFFPFDDSYISLAAARSVAEEFDLAVVPGRFLQGITSPLHVVLVGLLGIVTGVETAARLVSLLAFFAACLGAGLLAQRLTDDKRAFILASGLCLLSGPMLYDLGNGMETSLFTALVIWTLYLFERGDQGPRHIILRGVMAGCCVLTRPEGIFLAAAVCGVPIIRALVKKEKKEIIETIATAGVAFLVCLPYWTANLMATGHILPSSVSAKSMFFRRGRSSIPQLEDLKMPFMYFFRTAQVVGLVAVAGLCVRKRFVEIAFILMFYLSFLVRFPDSLKHYHARYQHPLWPIIAIGVALIVYWLAKKATEIFEKKNWVKKGLASALICLALGGWMLAETMNAAISWRKTYVKDVRQTARYVKPTVDYVRERSEPWHLIAVHDVGAMIYWSKRPILDIVGLTDERIAKRLAKNKLALAGIGPILFEKRPAYLVLMRKWEKSFLHLTKHAPEGTYTLVWSSPANKATGAIFDVYECQW